MGTKTWEKNGTSCRVGLALLLITIFPAITLAADVIVDGTTESFGPDDVIDNLTVINGGTALLDEGTVVNGDLRIEGQGSYANAAWLCTVVGNVTVKDGACLSMWLSKIGGNLHGIRCGYINFLISEVVGNVMIMEGGDFNAAYGPCKVGGNFLYKKAATIRLNWFTVGGNINLSDNQGAYIWIRNSTIANNVQVCNNVVARNAPWDDESAIANNTIGNNLQVCNNVLVPHPETPDEKIEITDNTIGENLQVWNNTPTATVTGNTVEGKVKVD